jgi:hypothetical protein
VLNDLENLNDETVTLRGIAVPLASDVGRAFICDAARNSEGLLNDGQITEKYGLPVETWRQLVKNRALARAVQRERERRIRTGLTAQESAAKLFAEAPKILGDIMNNPYSSPRHKVEAIRELRQTAIGADSEHAEAAADRFQITIVLSADEKLVIDKPIAPLTPDEARESRHDDTER